MKNLKQYLSETSIHGLSEYQRNDSTKFKVLWTLMLLGMAGLLVYYISSDVMRFVEKPTATMSRFEADDTFPAVAICTNDWINPNKLAKYNVSLGDENTKWKALSKLLGPLCPSVIRPSIFPQDWKDPEFWIRMVNERVDDDPENKINLEGLDYINILRDVAYNFEDIGRAYCGTCVNADQHEVKKIVKDVGVCWVVEPGKLLPPTNRMTRLPTLSLNLKFPSGGLIGEKSMFTVYLAEHAVEATGWSSGCMFPAKHNYVDVSVSYNRKVQSCNKTKGHTHGVCDAKCSDIEVKECGVECGIFSGDIPGTRRKNFCDFRRDVDEEIFACITAAQRKCGHCLGPCNYTTIQATVLPAPLILNDTDMEISVILRDIFNVMVYEEYFSYPWESLVSDLGGLLGLFLGASIISLAHAVYFFAFGGPGNHGRVDQGEDKRRSSETD